MQNFIIVLFVIIAVFIGLKESVKHFRGEGGCCGGSSIKPNRKKLTGKIIATYTFVVDGMHCQKYVPLKSDKQ